MSEPTNHDSAHTDATAGATVPAAPASSDATSLVGAEAAWHTWHDGRNEALAAPHGWLTLVSYTWLGPDPTSVPDFPGRWSTRTLDGELVAHVEFAPEDGVTRAAAPTAPTAASTAAATGEHASSAPTTSADIRLDEDDSDLSLEWRGAIAEVGLRGGRYMVRIRDPHSPVRERFTGVPTFDYAPDAAVPARFTPYRAPERVHIGTAMEGLGGVAVIVGEVSFSYAGTPTTLRVQSGGPGELTAVFHDETNGAESASWRFVSFPGPTDGWHDDPSAGESVPTFDLTIDFNRALNFPAAFTEFGTCPMPPAGNTIDAAVRAGERRPE